MTRPLLALPLCLVAGCAMFSSEPTQQPTPPTGETPVVAPGSSGDLDDEPADATSNAPVSLTASDGTGLHIVSFQARAVIEDPLAFTEIRLVFQNPEPRQLEGQFEITLPPTATLSRFAMKQAWGWQEGEVVELQAARRAYEDFLHRRQDPALLEKQPGNQFHAHVFPIPASGRKEIILSYSEALTRTGEPYRVHLRGLPVLEELDLHAIVSRSVRAGAASSLGGQRVQNEVVEVHKQHHQPIADFTVPLPAVTQQPQAGLHNGDLVLARVTPVGTAAPDPIDRGGLAILFDTSASRALGFEASVQKLGDLVTELSQRAGASTPLKVSCFDQDVETIYEGTLGGFDEGARKKILARRALGASDLGRALAALKDGKRYRRVLLVTDGIATAGDSGAALGKGVAELAQFGVGRLDAIVTGGIRDEGALEGLVTAGLPHDGVVQSGTRRASVAAQRLMSATVPRLTVSVPGATWVWPTELRGLQPGDQALIYAQRKDTQSAFVVNLDGGGAQATHMSYPIALGEVERPLLERAAVSAEIHSLEAARAVAKSADERAALHKQIVELSTKFRVLCDETALLVLETEDDYARFQIDRRALADILTVTDSGLSIISRRGQEAMPQQPTTTSQAIGADDESGGGESGKRRERKKALDRGPGGDRDDDKGKERELETAEETTISAADPSMQMAGPARIAPMMQVAEPARMQFRGTAGATASAPPPAPIAAVARRTGSQHIELAQPDRPAPRPMSPAAAASDAFAQQAKIDPYQGKLKDVMSLLAAKKTDEALAHALAWRRSEPGDVLALIALGEAYERKGERKTAARAYGSIIDLFPGRADLRRFAGERLERLAGDGALALAIDTFRKAREQRPDHPASHRLLAYALVRAGKLEEAFTVIREGSARSYPDGRFRGVARILKEDVGLVAAAWMHKDGNARGKIEKLVADAGAMIPTERSLRFVLNWETDANDVDFHILDGKGGHAFYSTPALESGGELYADVTTGYGPECFTITGKPTAYPYQLQAHYYSRGPMGYGMGKLEIIEHDGQGGLKIEERPFVIMVDHAFVDLGHVTGPLR